MVKLDLSRDYYADLELPAVADVTEVKKQFRKLALMYHPDRNPGKEAEVNAKFQTIQSAHEVLTNAEQKSKYDAHRSRNRYPGASGVRGNPWQNVSSQFPSPPKRAPTSARPASNSGASRYSGWVPPSQKSARESASDNMRAWDRMRPPTSSKPTQSSGTTPSTTPQSRTRRPNPPNPKPADQKPRDPPPTPRTESQRRKAEAAFGARRSPFVQVGDEPPVTNKNYFTTKQRTSLFNDTPSGGSEGAKPRPQSDNLDPLSRHFRDTFLDGRQSTPYSSHSGEKTNPFDGADLGRSGSVRGGGRDTQNTGGDTRSSSSSRRRRSSSVPDESENFKQATRDSAGAKPFGGDSRFAFSRAGKRYQPRESDTKPAPASAPASNPKNSTSSVNSTHATANGETSSKAKDGPTVYAPPFFSSASSATSAQQSAHPLHSNRRAGEGVPRVEKPNIAALMANLRVRVSPSGDSQKGARKQLNAFESKQHEILHDLINSREGSAEKRPKFQTERPGRGQRSCSANQRTDTTQPCSFTFPVNDDTFTPTTPDRFMRNSADNINTRFVAEEFANNDWQFQAGGPSEDSFVAAKRQARSRTRPGGRQSPAKTDLRFKHGTSSEPSLNEAGQKQSGFDPDQWSTKFGPQNFVPQPPQRPAASPTRPPRTAKKPKPVRMTAGTAGLVDEDDSSSEERTQPGTSTGEVGGVPPFGTDSPSAMDIDSPPPETATPTVPSAPTVPQPGGARGIPVEPSKPEWRAGSVNGIKPTPRTPLKDNARGSEDSDSFDQFTDPKVPDAKFADANFAGFKFAEFQNVAPFAPQPGGLGSLNDLKSDLPFESRPSAKIPLAKEAPKPIAFPAPPKSPHPPPALAVPGLKPSAVAWKTYSEAFHKYMSEFADFSARYVDHFAARRRVIDQNRRDTGFNWIESRGDTGIREYLRGIEEDKLVRQKWMAVCDVHELRVREFVKCRDKMMQ